MKTQQRKTTCRSFDMPDTPPHKNLRRRVGAAFVSGCLALSMCPALAIAQPSDTPDAFNAGGQMMGEQPPAMPEGTGQPTADFSGEIPGSPFGGDMQQMPESPDQYGQQAPENGFNPEGAPQPGLPSDQQQPGQMPGEGDLADPTQASNMNGDMQQPMQNGQQPGQPNQPGQPSADNQQPAQPGVSGQQPGQAPNMNGMQPPASPEQVRDIVERVMDILNVDKQANPIDQIMNKLGFGMMGAINQFGQFGQFGQPGQVGYPNQFEQDGQQMGQPGQTPGKYGQPGQTGQQQGQPGQPGQPNQNGQQPGQPGGTNDAPTSFDSANSPDTDADGATYKSTADSQNAVLVDGKTLTLSNITVDKTGSTDGENADFYGTNAAILANNGANLTITGANVTSDGAHANGVFSSGTSTSVTISDSTITTSGNNSGGLMITGGASMNATNLTVSTSGNSSAAIRTDRGGGTVTADQGSYATSGVGSPAIYSTADVTVSNATLSATNSEAVVIEGGNSVTLNNVNATGSNTQLNGQSTVNTNVLIYQSMSGDASEGASNFTMTGGSLTSLAGAMFHVTNTTTTIDLNSVALTNATDSDDLLIASADAWGTSGQNGGHATVNLTSQAASGDITIDKVSSVALNLVDSTYEGAISNTGTANVTIDANSTWTLTGNSFVTSLDNAGTINLNGYKLYVNGVLYTA